MTIQEASRRRPCVDELSRRASTMVAATVHASRLPDTVAADARLPLRRLPVRVTDRVPGHAERSQARILLAAREDATLALILTDVANAASPAVRGYYRFAGETLPREWYGQLAIDTEGRMLVVSPSGSAVIIAGDGIGFTATPFARPRDEIAGYARAMAAWQRQVIDVQAEAA